MNYSTSELAVLSKFLDEGLDIPRAAQAAWVDGLSGLEEHLKPALKQMLERDESDLLQTLPKLVKPLPDDGSQQAGLNVGPYRLIRELGRGGMGAVWLADRVDGALTRQVALKLPHAIHDAAFLERFHRERDILASFTHPNIAQIYDAGASAEGQPYIALEYVEGATLIQDCDARKLDVRERLEVFLQVLGAVHYAHAHLVVHRDLKPGNILVATGGEVKLLDFGIAKLMKGADAGLETELTQAGGRALTLDYAAPEQILGKPISTATDIYSLGVVLFELLAGARPYSLRRDFDVSPEQAIRTVQVTRPSQMIEAKQVAHTLKGDLDTIVLKALKADPAERYAGADAFAQDIRRYLSGQAVLAQPDSVTYRMRKFVLRHKTPVLAAAAVVIALAAGLSTALWQARVASRGAQTSLAVQGFLEDIFRANSADQPDPAKARQTTARELLDIGARKIKTELKNAPEARFGVLTTLASMYYDVGVDDEAVALNRERLTLAKALYGNRSAQVAKVLVDMGQALHSSSFVNERHAVLEEAKGILDQIGDRTSLTRSQLLTALAQEYNSTDQPKAVDFAHQAVELSRSRPPTQDSVEALLIESMLRNNLGQWSLAADLLSEAIPLSKKVSGDPNVDLARLYAYLGEANQGLTHLRAAEQNLRDAYDAARKLNGDDHVDTIQTGMRLGMFLVDSGLSADGLRYLEGAKKAVLKARGPDDPFHTPPVLFEYGWAFARAGRPAEGLDWIKQAVANRRKNRPNTIYLAYMEEVEAAVLIELGAYAEAQKLLDEAGGIRRKLQDKGDRLNTNSRVKLLLATNRPQEAATLVAGRKPPTQPGLSVPYLRVMDETAAIALALGDTTTTLAAASSVLQQIAATGLDRPYLKTWEASFALLAGEAQMKIQHFEAALPLLTGAVTLRHEFLDPKSRELAGAARALDQCRKQIPARKP